MESSEFNTVVGDTLATVESVLIRKGGEYAYMATDRLVAFKTGSSLTGDCVEHYCVDLMAKHTVSIFDMATGGDHKRYSQEQWDEKIIDNINYLILLRALIIERKMEEDSKKAQAISNA